MKTTRLRAALRACALLAALPLFAAGCDLDITNPNARKGDEVINDPNGLVGLAVGIQDQLASNIEDYVLTSALVTDEWGTGTASLLAYQRLLTGVGIDNTLGIVEAPWSTTFAVVRSANTLIASTPGIGGLDEGTRAGILALAELYKAMALGRATMQYQRVPITTTVDQPVPQPRAAVLDSVLALLESARGRLATNPDLTIFNARVKGAGLDLRNTVDAMLARHYLLDGQYQQAVDAAARVDLNVRSTFTYTAPDENPIKDLSIDAAYVYPLRSFTTQAEAGDTRAAYWVATNALPFVGNPDTTLLPLNQYTQRGDPFPIYLPDEMRLIQAEAYTRLGNFTAARDLINLVRTQTTPASAPIANLPALPAEALDTEAELLAQIAYERRYELYMQGLRWEDHRRLDAHIPTYPTLQFLPFPLQECITNPAACAT